MLTTELGLGGAEKVFYSHCNMLAKQYEVHVALFANIIHPFYTVDFPVHILNTERVSNPFNRWKARRRSLKNLLLQYQFDICISHMEGPNFLNASINGMHKKILVAHGSIYNNSQKGKANKFLSNNLLIPFFYNKADAVVTVSKGLTLEHEKAGVKKTILKTIYNFISIYDIKNKAQEVVNEFDFGTDIKTLVHVGRLAPEKNQSFMLRVLKALNDKGDASRLLLIGDGPLYYELLHQATDLDLKVFDGKAKIVTEIDDSYQVIFLGAQNNPFKYVEKSALFLLTSFNEGFPLVLVESLACKTPIVSVDCPTGPREILPANGEMYYGDINEYKELFCGNLVSYFPNQVNSSYIDYWVNAIIAAMKKRTQLSDNCTKNALLFDYNVISKEWYSLIDNLLK